MVKLTLFTLKMYKQQHGNYYKVAFIMLFQKIVHKCPRDGVDTKVSAIDV